MAAFNKRVHDGLKPGGIYFILDHQANPGTDDAGVAKVHRIEKATVIKEVTAAGFKLVGACNVLHRAADDHTKMSSDPAIKSHTDQFLLEVFRSGVILPPSVLILNKAHRSLRVSHPPRVPACGAVGTRGG